MKKLLMLMVCCFMAMPAFAAKCPGYVANGEYFVEYSKKDGFLVQRCTDGKLGSNERVKFCSNGSECLLGESFSTDQKDKRRLCVDKSYLVDTKSKGNNTQNLVLASNAGTDKNYLCYFCPEGTQHDVGSDKCIDVHEQSCTYFNGDRCGKSDAFVVEGGTHGCYSCGQKENKSCANGNRVFIQGESYLGGSGAKYTNYVWTCQAASGSWRGEKVRSCDNDIDWVAEEEAGRAEFVEAENTDRNRDHNNASSFKVTGNSLCAKYRCKTNYLPNMGTRKCELNSARQQACTESGGSNWTPTNGCHCEESLSLKPSSDGYRCECTIENYIWDPNAKKCIKDPAVEAAEQAAEEKKKADQQAAIDADAAAARQRIARQKACEESGGSFDGKQCSCFTEKNQKFDGVEKCICITNEYRFDNKDTGCVITDNAARERLCKMAGADAFWNGSECRCYDKDKVFVEGKTACEKPDYIIKCEKSKGAYWDSGLKECLCTVEGYVWNKKDACEKGAGLVAQEIQAEEERTRKRIADLTKDLFGKYNEMVSDVSVWKNKEGEFNTSRLASDSIAGVVLGTAGGLITSNVVKKSQVKSGFEDVQCTIGGQKVADWGDEFTVGIQ